MNRLFIFLGLFIVLTNQGGLAMPDDATSTETAIFGGGCFWCVEAAFENLPGVLDAESGYEGGTIPVPTYKQVCTGETGHAEVVRILFDPVKVTFRQLLDIFFKVHDPTQLNRQGNDVGTQYRSVIFHTSEAQETEAAEYIEKLGPAYVGLGPIVTELSPHSIFYPAEAYHQDYFAKNPNAGYCTFVIRPKLKKLGLEY